MIVGNPYPGAGEPDAKDSEAAGATRVLLVEDSRFDARLIETFLSTANSPIPVEVVHVTRLSEAAEQLQAGPFDCVLLDLGLPDGEGLGNIESIQEDAPDVAIIVLTGLKNDTVATTALQRGAQDYLVKGDYEDGDDLLRTIRYAVERRANEVLKSTQARQASESVVRGIVATVPDALVTLGEGGVIENANPAAERMFGYTADELVGMTVYDLNPEDRRADSTTYINGLLAGELEVDQGSKREGVGLRADGSMFPTEVAIGRMFVEGRYILVCAVRDITERKEAEDTIAAAQEQLIVQEKFASLGGLVAGVAHEINTPIGIGVTAASHLKERTDALQADIAAGALKKSALDSYLSSATQSAEMILGNLARAAALINGFKQVAVDQSSDDFRDFRVRAYLDDVLLSLKPTLKNSAIDVTIEVEPDDLTIYSHPGSWSQIITNLVVNAQIHAFEPGEPGQVFIHVKKSDQRIGLTVRDNGRGIAPEHIKQVFDPFFTTKRGQGGSGLGLNVVYNLATQGLGGSVRCESTLGEGVAFIFELPIRKP